MMFGLPFATFRGTVLALVLLAQLYLFLRARRAIRSSRRSDRFKCRAVGATGVAICVLFAANLCILFKPIPWVDPPAAAQIILFYPPVVWSLGSLFSALLLFLGQIAGFLARQTIHLAHRMSGRSAPVPVDPGRRLLLQAGAGGLFAVPLLLAGYGASHVGRGNAVQEMTLPFGLALKVVQRDPYPLFEIRIGQYGASLTVCHAGSRCQAEQDNEADESVRAFHGELKKPMCVEPSCILHLRIGTNHRRSG